MSLQSNFSNLHPHIILDAVENFGFEVSGQCYPLNSYENRVFQVGLVDNNSVVAKFYRPNRWALDTIKEEHQFSNALSDAGAPVAVNLKDSSGNTVHEIDGYFCALQRKVNGREPELEDLDNLFQIGQALGQLHNASTTFYNPQKSTEANIFGFQNRPVFDVKAMGFDNVQYLSNGLLLKQLSNKWFIKYQAVTEKLLKAIESCLPENIQESYIAVHGDCHLSNVLISTDGPMFLDFDDAMLAPAIQDVWMFLSGDKKQQHKQLSEIIEGYEEFHSFPAEQLTWIPALRALRVMNYTTWLAKRWSDPAFPIAFPWFNSQDFWMKHIKELEVLLCEFDLSEKIELNGNV